MNKLDNSEPGCQDQHEALTITPGNAHEGQITDIIIKVYQLLRKQSELLETFQDYQSSTQVCGPGYNSSVSRVVITDRFPRMDDEVGLVCEINRVTEELRIAKAMLAEQLHIEFSPRTNIALLYCTGELRKCHPALRPEAKWGEAN